MICRVCGCTDTHACRGGCWWAAPGVCNQCVDRAVDTGQLWHDADGHARICGVVTVEQAKYAVLLRTRGAGGRKRRPFLFPVDSLLKGDDGWLIVPVRKGAQA
jgi:hypothetical protein